MTGCSKSAFRSHQDVVDYCMSRTGNFTKSCDLENCILSYSSGFSAEIRYATEKNYLECQLRVCKNG
jgi:hypothetical protein